MTYQEYLKLSNKLTAQKDALYDIADLAMTAAMRIYAEIDAVQAELDALVNPQDRMATDEELTFKFDN